jgi:hypothetical protein
MNYLLRRFFHTVSENDMNNFLDNECAKLVVKDNNGIKCSNCYTIAVAHNQKLLICNKCNQLLLNNDSFINLSFMIYDELYISKVMNFDSFKDIMTNRVNNSQTLQDINMNTYKREHEDDNSPNKKIKR